ncbi:maleylpyruvate isomerase N-terminal domain-containing protein [Iamia majanohamensis]|uniref:Maleylpyruvate isomerase N-terminal domain-containing protein n=1 Tax=Iamia majanohamensis TaxID=467976 RepID=A0AAE9Y667_9ACTN|nr:maleylpyruvate isomerase N-terminal domain-containing protein [Iamia majanohamensis]WCO67380.1 maleylpyruvate isomerase N-terminal domain-containing protein [Iamia majanohamensis]
MDAQTHLAAVVAEGRLVADLPPSALDAPVAACPGWDVARLVGHLGRVHAWAASFLALGPHGGDPDPGPRPPTGAALLPWYRDRLEDLVEELGRHDPDEATAGFAGPTTVAFWFRRQAHELAVHRWDAQHAVAPGEESPIGAELAADGVDEWLEVFVPRFLARTGVPDDLVGATLHLHCTDEGGIEGTGEWLLRLTAEGCEVERAHAKGDAALRAPAAELFLAVWHRQGIAALDVVGDAARAEAILDAVHVT